MTKDKIDAIDIQEIRNDFPILSQKVYNKPLVYLDNAATTQKPSVVIDRLRSYYERENSNIHRGVHFLSDQATAAHEAARKMIAGFIHAASPAEIVFTRGTTESVNLVAGSFGKKFIGKGDEVLVTQMEHHSNIVPWQMMCEERGAVLRVVPLHPGGELDTDAFENMLNEKTRLVALAHVSNVLGTINPVKALVAKAHDAGAKVLIDGAQAVAHLRVDVADLDCDFYCFSGHKVYSPMGIGVLYGKEEILEQLPPWQGGGEMIKQVSFEKTTYNELPFKFEAGTPNVAGVLGLEAGLNYLQSKGLDEIVEYEDALLTYAAEKLQTIKGIRFFGEAKNKTAVISFLPEGIHPFDVGTIVDKYGVAIRTGHMCAQPLTTFYGVPGFVRMSLAMYNTKDEIDKFTGALAAAIEMLS
jgi:cysteine desulfurase/selenocysteine lyase